MAIEELLFSISEALLWPVLIAAIFGLAWAIVETGILLGELWRRRWRSVAALEAAVERAAADITRGDGLAAISELSLVAWNRPMLETMEAVVTQRPLPDAENRIAKRMADYDYRSPETPGADQDPGAVRPRSGTDGHADPALAGAGRPG